jgi:lysosomal Pro-X carboxypeptidase
MVNKLFVLLSVASHVAVGTSILPNSPWIKAAEISDLSQQELSYKLEERWFPQYIDHFNFMGTDSADTFQQRYMIDDTHYDEKDPKIFFYCGNEGDITLFINNTGFMFEVAQEMKALVVFAEHRYYGKSLPFGDQTYATVSNLRYLSIEQALADYTALVRSLKTNMSIPNAPVIGFGGSYGGMLSAWWRMKYPAWVSGSIAASAPILQIPGVMDPLAYNRVIRQTFQKSDNKQAAYGIYLAFKQMQVLGNTQSGRDLIATQLRLCDSLKTYDDVWGAVYYLSNAIGYMAMADYPYPAAFLGPMPAFPASYAGQFFPTDPSTASTESLLKGMADGIANVFYNFSGQAGACFNLTQQDPPGLQGSGWNIQCCREVVQPIGSAGWPNDLFWSAPFNTTQFIESCQSQFGGTTPRPYLQLEEYGGRDLSGISRIFFSNGELDPWISGGITTNGTFAEEHDVIAYVIKDGAHHLDLRASDPADPEGVIVARNMERAAIRRWIKAHSKVIE